VTRVLYIDAIAGVAGDMLLGALVDAGADPDAIGSALDSLGIDGLGLELGVAERQGIRARRATIAAPPEANVHRTWADVRQLLMRLAAPAPVVASAERVFAALAKAEARVHGVSPDDVHFHEVGAVDAIGDVVGIAVALHDLGVDRIIASSLPMPRGFVTAAHGRLPLPAPATVELLRGALVHGVELDVELVTPTGAAVVASLCDGYGPIPPMRLESAGYGGGSRDLRDRPNVVRVLLGTEVTTAETHEVVVVEANVDDLPPQLVPDVVGACFTAGALDVWVTPTQMKKARPGLVVSALARPDAERPVVESLLRESTTIGVRVSSARRWELERSHRSVQVAGCEIGVKEAWLGGEVVNRWPEYEDCRSAAHRIGSPVKAVWSAAVAAVERSS
jgi:pyridinium-3,5-bisthiocarboxylic acid mononucleotide nickel chelatase